MLSLFERSELKNPINLLWIFPFVHIFQRIYSLEENRSSFFHVSFFWWYRKLPKQPTWRNYSSYYNHHAKNWSMHHQLLNSFDKKTTANTLAIENKLILSTAHIPFLLVRVSEQKQNLKCVGCPSLKQHYQIRNTHWQQFECQHSMEE